MTKEELYYEPNSKTLREEPQVFTRWIDPTIEQLQQENKQLKERINKAIKWIEECKYYEWHCLEAPHILIEILGDKENE